MGTITIKTYKTIEEYHSKSGSEPRCLLNKLSGTISYNYKQNTSTIIKHYDHTEYTLELFKYQLVSDSIFLNRANFLKDIDVLQTKLITNNLVSLELDLLKSFYETYKKYYKNPNRHTTFVKYLFGNHKILRKVFRCYKSIVVNLQTEDILEWRAV